MILGITFALSSKIDNNFNFNERKTYNDLSVSAFYYGPIIIDDNGGTAPPYSSITWAEAVFYDWCSGGGTINNPYIIDDLTIDGQDMNDCLIIRDSSAYFIVRNSFFHRAFTYGVWLDNVTNGKLNSISCFECYIGIKVNGDNNQILNSWVYGGGTYGISVFGYYNIISGNNVNDNSLIGIECYYSNNIIDSNFVWFNDDGIMVLGGENDIISNNFVHDNEGNGIWLWGCSKCLILDNKAHDNKNGIVVTYNNAIYDIDNEIKRNEVYNNSNIGIAIGSSRNIIIDNEIYNNKIHGIGVYYSSKYNNITKNNVYGNEYNGIYLVESDRNSIFENKILNNTQAGIFVSDEGYRSDMNNFYNNIFMENSINAIDNMTSSSWDFNGIGNYWDDYPGKDLNDDGIGDSPYLVPGTAGNLDHYPIWDDGDSITPDIQINFPSMNDVFGFNSPAFNITINDASPINTAWYTIDGGLTNFTFSGLTGNVNQTAWDKKGAESITLIFYANDTFGNIGFKNVLILKDLESPIITINSPTPNQLCGVTAPTFNIQIIESNLQEKWYSFNSGQSIYFTTETQFIQSEWDKVENGTVLITFYALDEAGNMNSTEIVVRKDAYVPDISIHTPLKDQKFGRTAPDYNISIIEEDLVSTWYTIEGIAGTFSFTELTGTINQDAWDDAPKGDITITFYALDRAGNIGNESVIVIKRIPSEPIIPGYSLFLVSGILSVAVIIISKKLK